MGDKDQARQGVGSPSEEKKSGRRLGIARMRGVFYFRPRHAAIEVCLPDRSDAEASSGEEKRKKRGRQINRVIRDEAAWDVADAIIEHIKEDTEARDTIAAALRTSAAGQSAQAMLREVTVLAGHDPASHRFVAKVARALADETLTEDVRRVADRLDDPIVRAAMATTADRKDIAALLEKLDQGLGGTLREAIGIFAHEPAQRDALAAAADLAEGGPDRLSALGTCFLAARHGHAGHEAIEAALQVAGSDLVHLELLKTLGRVCATVGGARSALASTGGAMSNANSAEGMARVLADERVLALLQRLGDLRDEYEAVVDTVVGAGEVVLDAPEPRSTWGRFRRAFGVVRKIWA